MIENGDILVSFSIQTIEKCVIQCHQHMEVKRMPLSEFFQTYLSPEKLGIEEDGYNYESFCAFALKEKASTITTYYSKQNLCLYRFMFFQSAHSNIILCSLIRITNTENKDYFTNRDVLTGVYTRSTLLQKLEKSFKDETCHNYSIVLLDLNDFKHVNEIYGRGIGDKSLSEIALSLQNIFHNQMICRYGGDEFFVLLENCDNIQIEEYIQKLLDYEYYVSDQDRSKIRVTIRASIVSINDEIKSMAEALDAVTSTLAEVKKKRRNAVMIYQGKTYFSRAKTDPLKHLSMHIHSKPKKKKENMRLFTEELKARRIRNFAILLVLVLLLLCSSILVGSILTRQLNTKKTEEATNIMNDISSQISSNISSSIESWNSQLIIASRMLSNIEEGDNYEEYLNRTLQIVGNTITFDEIALLLESGDLYFNSTTEYNIASEDLAKNIIIERKEYIGSLYINYWGERIAFAIPYDGIESELNDPNSNRIYGLVGLLTIENFSKLLYSDAFSEQAYMSLVQKDGNRLITSLNVNEGTYAPYNVYNAFKKYANESEMEVLEQSLNEGKTNIMNLQVGKTNFLTYCTKIDDDSIDWRIIIMVSTDIVLSSVTGVFERLGYGVYIALFFFVCIVSVMVYIHNQLRTKNQMLTYMDKLTNDINDERFKIDAETLIKRNGSTNYCLVYMNFSNYKYARELFDTATINKILKEVFEVVHKSLNFNELETRLSVNNYVILMEYTTEQVIKQRLMEIQNRLNETIHLDDLMSIIVSFGVYILPPQYKSIVVAIDRASEAQKLAENRIDSHMISFFDEKMMAHAMEEMELEKNQDKALKSEEFTVYYQLKKDIQQDKWGGVEALVRWKDPVKGMVSPGKFIPLFEKNGFVIKVDLYVFSCVCRDMRRMLDEGITPVPVSVNLSRRHLMIDHFLDEFVTIMNQFNIPRELIEFELTEGMIFENESILYDVIHQIHEIGCRCSIDDFGSGYSSLNMLKEFDFDVIKLDRKFFYGINGFDENSKTIVRSLTELSHQLGKEVVAEGIEDEQQVSFLRNISCNLVQGYYYAKPVPYDEYIVKLNQHKVQ